MPERLRRKQNLSSKLFKWSIKLLNVAKVKSPHSLWKQWSCAKVSIAVLVIELLEHFKCHPLHFTADHYSLFDESPGEANQSWQWTQVVRPHTVDRNDAPANYQLAHLSDHQTDSPKQRLNWLSTSLYYQSYYYRSVTSRYGILHWRRTEFRQCQREKLQQLAKKPQTYVFYEEYRID